MKMLQPLSEDFLYWNPEDICRYPEAGPEDAWFITRSFLCEVIVDNQEGVLHG